MKWFNAMKEQVESMQARDRSIRVASTAADTWDTPIPVRMIQAEQSEPQMVTHKPTSLKTVDVSEGGYTRPLPTLSKETQDYLALARSAGLTGVASAVENANKLKIEEVNRYNASAGLRQFLAENGITVYAAESVRAYMDRITPKGMNWLWVLATTGTAVKMPDFRGMKPRTYTKPIPDVVIMTIQKIRDAFPTSIFEVTDIVQMPKPDPFLRVGLVDDGMWSGWSDGIETNVNFQTIESFIIERWDEPGFRM